MSARDFLEKWYPSHHLMDEREKEWPIISWNTCLEMLETYHKEQEALKYKE